MKNFISTLFLCILFININAQPKNFNGYYRVPNSNHHLTNTAITNFVSNKMLIIDTYDDQINLNYYLVLTFVDDLFNPISTIKYVSPNPVIAINDVIYDVTDNSYIACGYENHSYLGGVKNGIIVKFDASGSEIWRSDGYNTSTTEGASEYRRVEKVTCGTQYYAVCGWHEYSSSVCYGVIGFYDIGTGMLQYMSMPNNTFNYYNYSQYMDLVFDPINNMIAIVGKYHEYASPNAKGMLREQLDVAGNISAGNIILRSNFTQINMKTTSITIDNDPNYPSYYIAGSINDSNLYIAKVDASTFNVTDDHIYKLYDTTFFDVRDICFNSNSNPKSAISSSQLGIIGQASNNNNNPYKGFLFELNTNNLAQIGNGLSFWSGQYYPGVPPFYDAHFDHITNRDNNYSGINYSYIMHGGFNNSLDFSYLAEFYPQINPDTNICQEIFMDYAKDTIVLTEITKNPSTINAFENYLPELSTDDIYIYFDSICESPNYTGNNQRANKTTKTKITQNSIAIENGVIKLNDSYIQSLCNIYSIDGKLILTKQIGVSLIATQSFKPGMYILQPINDVNLRPLKFSIIH